MGAIAAAIIAIAKAVPACERLLAMVVEAYGVWRHNQNNQLKDEKDARNDAAVDAAVGADGLHLCAACPFAVRGRGQHSAADSPSGLPAGGGGGS